MKIKKLGIKISLLVVLMIVVTIATILYSVITRTGDMVDELTYEESATANGAFVHTLQRYQEEALTRAEMIAGSTDIITAVTNKDGEGVKKALENYSSGLDLITLCDKDGIVLARSHNDQTGDSVLNQKAISTALETGKGISTIESGTVIGLSTRGSAAIKDRSGNIIGALTCGHDLSQTKYVDKIKETNHCEATFFAGDERMNTTLIDESGNRVIGTKANEDIADIVLNQKKDYQSRIMLFGSNYAVYYSPLIIDNEAVGMLFTGVNVDGILGKQQAMTNWILMIAIVAVVISTVLVFVFSIFMISRPLKKIGGFARKIEIGDIGISTSSESTIDVRSVDEIGDLARVLEHTYKELAGYVGEIQERMQGLADGDLITESNYEFQGDFVLIKDAINNIVRNMNQTMAEVSSSADQVSAGAQQIADGAQLLAQGATEQSATVEQLAATVSDVAEKTRINAKTANEAENLSESIKEKAEQGSRQMDQMMQAVKEINESSQSIGKVIKIIDDIAFQTNILALNAAVEAARAGQYGKGFAVVADEVRSLAAKSAEAAKNTNELIETSIQKAEMGASISHETSESLKQIVEGIIRNSELITDISRASDEQSAAISQISEAIDQVSQVVQQNSATSEESAAASEEMSGQSSLLQQMISRFKIKRDGGRSLKSIPPKASSGMADQTGFSIQSSDKY